MNNLEKINWADQKSLPLPSEQDTAELRIDISTRLTGYVGVYSFSENRSVLHCDVPLELMSSSLFWIDAQARLDVARRVIRALRRAMQYRDLYMDFERGVIEKEEFKKEALKYASETRSISAEKLSFEYQTVLDLSGEESLDTEEAATMLDLDSFELSSIVQTCERNKRLTG